MKKYLYMILVAIVLSLSAFISVQHRQLTRYKTLYQQELQNVEAYQAKNSGLEELNRQYVMTMDDLRSSKDSLDMKIANMVDELKIKDSKIEYLQYQTKVVHSTDTVQMPDTIFVPETHIDTTIQDDWYKLKLRLDYPSSLVVSPTFNSEQYVVINSKKEYNKKPSKIFFIRWFQKKHTVVEVNIEEKSPYIVNKENKFIKVIK